MDMEKRKICIVTSARADWGLLQPVAAELRRAPEVELQIVATNMHLMPKYGMTVNEIEADGFKVDERVAMDADGDAPLDKALATSRCMAGMAEALARLRPDIVLLLGDRYEMLAVASAATILGIPIAHISGGEITEGAIDDNIRHALTKLSSLHFTATETYRRRVIQMGEDPERVWNAGATGVYNIVHTRLMPKNELEESIGFRLDRDTLLVTLHPVTRDTEPAAERCAAMLRAIDRFPRCRVLFTYPNNDADGSVIISMIEEYAARNPERCLAVPSLGRLRYLSALKCVGAVVGNSSSGVVEVPSAGIPTVDIGPRQRGRIAAGSVIHCRPDTDSIAAAIAEALSQASRARAAACHNPYYRPDTPATIARALAGTPLDTLNIKHFHDL